MSTETVLVKYNDQPEEVAWNFARLVQRLGHTVRIVEKGDPHSMTYEVDTPEPVTLQVWYDDTPAEVVNRFISLLVPFGVKVTNTTEQDRHGLTFSISMEPQSCEPQP